MSSTTVPTAVRGEELALSFTQGRLWFLNRLQGPRPNYNETARFRFRGVFDVPAMSAALADVVNRHESLRTIFPETRGVPRQVVLSAGEATPPLTEIICTSTELRSHIADLVARPFDLTTEAPLRAYRFPVLPDRTIVLLVIHHIAVDWWSIHRILVRDLIRAYDSRCAGRAPDFAPLPLRYADYTVWQKQRLGDEKNPESLAAKELGFWVHALTGAPDPLRLPADRPRPLVPTYLGERAAVLISPAKHRQLSALARSTRTSLFAVMHALVATLLTRLGVGADIPIGSAVSGRKTTASQHVVGFFANTIVVRNDTSGCPTFRELLVRTRSLVLDACAHDEVPFERIVEALNPSRSISRNPIFQVMLGFKTQVLAKKSRQHRLGGDLGLSAPAHSRFDLAFELTERRGIDRRAGGVVGLVQAGTDVFDRVTAARVAARLSVLTSAAIETPDAPIDQLAILPADEQAALVRLMTATAAPDPVSIVDQIIAQAAARPNRVAVKCSDRRMTWAELDARARDLARQLIEAGVGPQQVVAVMMERSVDLVAALVGGLYAGVIIAPLDPESSARELRSTLNAILPAAILADPASRPLATADCPIVIAGDITPATQNFAAITLPASAGAVVVTTNGTTEPKAVLLTLGNLRTAVDSLMAAIGHGDASWLAISAIGTDSFVIEILAALAMGRDLVVAASEDLLYPSLLGRIVTARPGSAFVQSSPTALWAMAAQLPEAIPRLQVVVGRERRVSDEVWKPLRESGCAVRPHYGATETSGWSIAVAGPDAAGGASPLPGHVVRILDHRLQLSPFGVEGDLYIGGSGVAAGYVGCPALTAGSFVADPMGEAGARLFRTGDCARWTHDGRFEFVRRAGAAPADAEPVECLLRSQAGISDAVVVHTAEDRVAYAVSRPGHRLDADALLDELRVRVPHAALPSAIVVVDRLPLSHHGRLDLASLPPPPPADAARRHPATDTERRLCELFADVLGVADIGVHDRFFARGGHSLSAMRLVNRISAAFGLEVDVRIIFEAETPAGIARRVDAHRAAATAELSQT